MAASFPCATESTGDRDLSRVLRYSLLLIIILVCVLCYGPMLEQFFTGTDTITLIETSRITTLEDLHRIVAKPLMAGTDFLQVARFYRPLSTLSYSMDYWLWGMNPTGFHLTNLLLHTLTAVLIFLMMRSSFHIPNLPAGLAGIIFALHPILVETVPSLDRRHDVIAALFMILCVMFCAKYLSAQYYPRRYLVLSVLCQVGALASKETAFFLPLLILGFLWLFTPASGLQSRAKNILYAWCPYICTACVYLLWRMHVLDGLGGYSTAVHGTWGEKQQYLNQMALSYLYDLLSPIDNMWQPFLDSPIGIALLGAILAILPMATEYLYWKKSASESSTYPYEPYKIRVFLLWWLLLPLAIYGMTLTFGHRGMYIPTIALSCLIGLNFQAIATPLGRAQSVKKAQISSLFGRHFVGRLPIGIAVIVSVFAVCLMARYSPLVCNYGAWQESAQLTSNLLRQFVVSASILPNKSCVFLNQVPDSLANLPNMSPHPKEVAFPRDYSFASWLKLYLPRSHARVILGKRCQAKYFSGLVRLSNCLWTKRTLVVFVSMGKGKKTR